MAILWTHLKIWGKRKERYFWIPDVRTYQCISQCRLCFTTLLENLLCHDRSLRWTFYGRTMNWLPPVSHNTFHNKSFQIILIAFYTLRPYLDTKMEFYSNVVTDSMSVIPHLISFQGVMPHYQWMHFLQQIRSFQMQFLQNNHMQEECWWWDDLWNVSEF